MKVLWICNIMLPVIAEALHKEASNKEGWLSGLLEQVAAENSSDLELAVAFRTAVAGRGPGRHRHDAGSGFPGTRRCGSTVETPRAGTPDEPLRDG